MSILLGFLDLQHGAAFIHSAFGAGAMGQLLLVAARALGEPGCGEKVVGTAVSCTARGVAPLRIRHDVFSLSAISSQPSAISFFVRRAARHDFPEIKLRARS